MAIIIIFGIVITAGFLSWYLPDPTMSYKTRLPEVDFSKCPKMPKCKEPKEDNIGKIEKSV